MIERILTRGEVPRLIEAHHPLEVIYQSLLVKCEGERNKPVSSISTVGFEDETAKAIQETLGMPIEVLGPLTEITPLDTTGLYIVLAPDKISEALLGRRREGEGTHAINGIARIICQDRRAVSF